MAQGNSSRAGETQPSLYCSRQARHQHKWLRWLIVIVGLMLLAVKSSGAIRRGIAERDGMTAAIEATLGIHTIGSIWLIGCALFLFFW